MEKFEKYRLVVFICVFAVMLIWELLLKRRELRDNKFRRWFENLFIIGVDNLVVRLFNPFIPILFAVYCERSGFGIFNLVKINNTIEIIISIVLLDFIIYFQHFV
jgi:sterol desaturase/sphingolipid hydroxylase (fatty acid hydroxylase superfamily)